MKLLPGLATIVFVLALPVFLVTSNIRFFAGEAWFYERGFRDHNADVTTGVDLAQLNRAAAEIRDYFENDAERLDIMVTVDGRPEPLFSEREVLHMVDVKQLMRVTFRVHEVALAIVLTTIAARFIWSREASIRTLAWQSLAGLAVGGVAMLAVGALALTGFDSAWNQFHELLFTNDLWQLNPDRDRLIQMFPEAFWQESVIMIAAMTLAEAAIITTAACAYLWATRGDSARAREAEAASPVAPSAGAPGPVSR